jgi:hypothetical protein
MHARLSLANRDILYLRAECASGQTDDSEQTDARVLPLATLPPPPQSASLQVLHESAAIKELQYPKAPLLSVSVPLSSRLVWVLLLLGGSVPRPVHCESHVTTYGGQSSAYCD